MILACHSIYGAGRSFGNQNYQMALILEYAKGASLITGYDNTIDVYTI